MERVQISIEFTTVEAWFDTGVSIRAAMSVGSTA
jgi:hypothetical protein